MKRFLRWIFERRQAVLIERGELFKLLTSEQLVQMKRRWAQTLAGRAQDPCVKVIMEMIEMRISQGGVMVQWRDSHAGNNLAQVSYSAAAGLNDLLLEVVRVVHEGQR